MSEKFFTDDKLNTAGACYDPDSLIRLYDSLQKIIPGPNVLSEARKRTVLLRPRKDTDRFCQFCGLPIYGTNYFQQSEGICICPECYENGVHTTEELEILYKKCKDQLSEDMNGKLMLKGITVTLASLQNQSEAGQNVLYKVISPTGNRLIGQISKTEKSYCLQVENGISRTICMYVLICELTFLWQKENWKSEQLEALCKRDCPDHADQAYKQIQSGMAEWAGVEFLYLNSETAHAHEIDLFNSRTNMAYRLYRKMYPFQTFSSHLTRTPFLVNRYPVDLKQLNHLYS